jgi:hypothetical protein
VEPVVLADRPRNLVLRCRAESGGSVVVKRFKPGHELGWVEWASLAFLAELAAARGVVPRFLSGDVAGRFVVVEDLGGSESLDDVLAKGDAARARRTLRALAAAYGRLHAATIGAEARFERIRERLPGADAPAREREAAAWLGARARVEAWFAATEVAPHGLDGAMATVAATYRAPGPWLTFTHGDPAPSNNHVAGGEVRLLDFEYGGFRHALYDLTAWDVLCPLPAPLVAEMRDAHRETIAPVLPAESYDQEWHAMVAYRAMAMLTWVEPGVAADAPWHGDWTKRQAVLVAALRLSRAAAEHRALAAVAPAASALADALAERWPAAAADPLPRWPALGASRA